MTEATLAAANVKIVHDKKKNLQRFTELIDEAADKGVDVLVLPEAGLQGYADFDLSGKAKAEQKQYYFREAEPIPGPSTQAIAALARKHDMLIQLGMAERALHGNAIYNSTALIGPEGVIGIYRKVHNQFEFPYFNPGEEMPVFETPLGVFGSIICYDLCFPELLRTYAVKGADVVLMSTAWPMRGHDRATDYHGWAMDTAAQGNAFFNQNWLVISNHCEKGAYSQNVDYYGGSQIVDPRGKVVSYLAEEEGLVVHTADLQEEILKSRTEEFFGLNLLQDRRPEHYAAVVDQSHRYPSETLPVARPATKPRALKQSLQSKPAAE
ncbi:carbon-nitrogen hydrolase family protein [Rhizobium sp. BK376]|uniref:carbon-nitrogen hydrolase family protein n=1 Tax=Rhizobium sp. BK376 TaxID=2512149 RepID=UPI00104C6921|nr:carbon-nitrogen hydrolase family protein [Rhizobium sp. BK376]TCR75589.1 putative amidohydrolase [Rhizobium sp. BK376]